MVKIITCECLLKNMVEHLYLQVSLGTLTNLDFPLGQAQTRLRRMMVKYFPSLIKAGKTFSTVVVD